MSAPLLDMAANVRQKRMELDATHREMRRKNGEWSDQSWAAECAMKIAEDGLRNCFAMLQQLHMIAREELKRGTTP